MSNLIETNIEPNTIDSKINRLNRKLDGILMETHPNISRVWREYINIKYEKLANTLNTLEQLIENTPDYPDVPLNNIILMFSLFNSMNN
tara:strand:- start:402 stop:668 length:267 start_codon:yes stop_codon:yes gene_type:complete